MPAPKVLKNSEQYYEIKAKYEAGDTLDEIIVFYKEKYDISITRRTIERWAKEDNWQKGRLKDLYDAKKLVKTQDILNQFKPDNEKKGYDILETEAEKQAKANAELEIKLKAQELARMEKHQKTKDYGTDLLLGIMEALQDIVKSGKNYDNAMETFEYDSRGKLETKNVISTASKYKIIKEANVVEILKGIGILQTPPTVAIQNNNHNSQEVEVKTKEIPQIVFSAHENDK